MMKFCSTCRHHSRAYKVHFRSESCSECLYRNQRWNVYVTENKWKKLKIEKFKLYQKICDALAAQEETRKTEDKTVFERRMALIKKMCFRQQMNLLKKRVDEVITLKKTQISEEHPIMNFDSEDSMLFLYLDSFIWSALDELFDFFWQFSDFDKISLTVSDNLSNS